MVLSSKGQVQNDEMQMQSLRTVNHSLRPAHSYPPRGQELCWRLFTKLFIRSKWVEKNVLPASKMSYRVLRIFSWKVCDLRKKKMLLRKLRTWDKSWKSRTDFSRACTEFPELGQRQSVQERQRVWGCLVYYFSVFNIYINSTLKYFCNTHGCI